MQSSVDVVQLVNCFNWLYCGFFVFLPDFPDWEGSWIPNIVYMRYCYQGMVLNEFQNNNNLPKQHEYIHNMGFDTISIQGCIGILFLFLGSFSSLFYFLLCYYYKEDR